jgi:hypothetical protein
VGVANHGVGASCLLLAGTLGIWTRTQWATESFSFTMRAADAADTRLQRGKAGGSSSSLALGIDNVTMFAEAPNRPKCGRPTAARRAQEMPQFIAPLNF